MKPETKIKYEEILKYIKANKNATKASIAKANDVSPRTVNRAIEYGKSVGEPKPKNPKASSDKIKYLISETTIVIQCDDEIHTINSTHTNFDAVKSKLENNDFDNILNLVNIPKAIEYFYEGNIEYKNGTLWYKDMELNTTFSHYIIHHIKNNLNYMVLVKFLNNLMKNPANHAINEMFLFLIASKAPITSDGHFLAYKVVNNNYTDIHTAKIDNSVGQVVKMERNMVDDNRDNTCSTGLHFCAAGYIGYMNGYNRAGKRVVIVKINPKDVVSIPSDYNDMKGRCCEYKVVQDISDEEKLQEFSTSSDEDGYYILNKI